VASSNIVFFRRFIIQLPGETHEIVCVTNNAAWNDPSNLVTITKYHTDTNFFGKPISVLNPNGTMVFYSYNQSTNGLYQTNIVTSGQPGPGGTNIIDGTETITVIDPAGHTLSQQSLDIVSGITIANDVYSNFDEEDRAQTITHVDGTTTLMTYNCC